MDVRCERCQTEYELEDETVSEAGTQVQCTTCGHTFLVSPAEDHAAHADEAPPLADWLLETGDGQVHRFRNLTSLQKWIIERKVTRNDKISRTGHAWRRLGEIVELGPFFDVVDEADRARATSARNLVAEAEAARRAATRPSPASPMPAYGAAAGRRATPARGARPASTSASNEFLPLEGGLEGGFEGTEMGGPGVSGERAPAEFETAVVRTDGAPWIKTLVGLGMAGAVAWAGIAQPWKAKEPLPSLTAQPALPPAGATPPPAPPAGAAPSIPSAPGALPLEAALAAAGKSPGSAGAPAAAPAAAAPNVASPAPVTAPAVAASAQSGAAPAEVASAPPAAAAPDKAAAKGAPKSESKGEAQGRPGGRPADEAGGGGGRSYERLVAEADRLLENGGTARAMKLYDQALALRPTGPEAIAGLGYVNLDRGRGDIAIGYFKRALASSYPGAAFGLGEAHRQGGDSEQALAHYEKYLQLAPSGPDAAAARRQIKALQAKLAGGQASAQAPAPAPQPAAGATPVSPSSVLSEPAKP